VIAVRFLSAFMRGDGVAVRSSGERMQPAAPLDHHQNTPGYFESLPRHHIESALQPTLSAKSPLSPNTSFLYMHLGDR